MFKSHPSALVSPESTHKSILIMFFIYRTYDEQQKIGAFLRNLDNLITLHQRGEKIYNRRQT